MAAEVLTDRGVIIPVRENRADTTGRTEPGLGAAAPGFARRLCGADSGIRRAGCRRLQLCPATTALTVDRRGSSEVLGRSRPATVIDLHQRQWWPGSLTDPPLPPEVGPAPRPRPQVGDSHFHPPAGQPVVATLQRHQGPQPSSPFSSRSAGRQPATVAWGRNAGPRSPSTAAPHSRCCPSADSRYFTSTR